MKKKKIKPLGLFMGGPPKPFKTWTTTSRVREKQVKAKSRLGSLYLPPLETHPPLKKRVAKRNQAQETLKSSGLGNPEVSVSWQR